MDCLQHDKVLEELESAIEDGSVSYSIQDDFKDVQFDDLELKDLMWTFIESDCTEQHVIKFLMGKGLDIERGLRNGSIPLVYAVGRGKFGAVEALLQTGVCTTYDDVFLNATRILNGKMVRLLVKYGADVNTTDDVYGTALHMVATKAVISDHMSCLTLFLEAGAKEVLAEVQLESGAETVTPSQYIEKKFKDDKELEVALGKALDLLSSYKVDS